MSRESRTWQPPTSRSRAWQANARRAPKSIAGSETLFHVDDDRQIALAQINRDFARFRIAAEPQLLHTFWWREEALPMFDAWSQFRRAEIQSSIDRVTTAWSTYQSWLDQLRKARTNARILGAHLPGPEPSPLPQTLFEAAESGLGTEQQKAWTLGRTVFYTAIGVAGIIALAKGTT